jgi:hypothetical protein
VLQSVLLPFVDRSSSLKRSKQRSAYGFFGIVNLSWYLVVSDGHHVVDVQEQLELFLGYVRVFKLIEVL